MYGPGKAWLVGARKRRRSLSLGLSLFQAGMLSKQTRATQIGSSRINIERRLCSAPFVAAGALPGDIEKERERDREGVREGDGERESERAKEGTACLLSV